MWALVGGSLTTLLLCPARQAIARRTRDAEAVSTLRDRVNELTTALETAQRELDEERRQSALQRIEMGLLKGEAASLSRKVWNSCGEECTRGRRVFHTHCVMCVMHHRRPNWLAKRGCWGSELPTQPPPCGLTSLNETVTLHASQPSWRLPGRPTTLLWPP